jgi:hypothetical protein
MEDSSRKDLYRHRKGIVMKQTVTIEWIPLPELPTMNMPVLLSLKPEMPNQIQLDISEGIFQLHRNKFMVYGEDVTDKVIAWAQFPREYQL